MKFCSYCGKQLNDGEACTCPGALEELEAKKNKFSKVPVNKIKKLAIPVAIFLVVVIAVICLVSYVQTEIDLEEYIVVKEVTGLNGQGVISYSLDKSALSEVLVDEEDYSKVNEKNYEEVMGKFWAEQELAYDAMESIKLEASQETGLSNGDVVTIKASFENTDNLKLPYHFKAASIKYTVSGLADGKELDAFAEGVFVLSFAGFTGMGEAEVEILAQDEVYDYIRYELSEAYDLTNGDTVTVTVKYNAEKLEALGYFTPEVTEKTFTVEGLHEYATAADIPAPFVEEKSKELLNDLTKEMNSEVSEYNIVRCQPEIWYTYFASTEDPSVICSNYWYGLEMQNAVVILGHYAMEYTGFMGYTDDNWVARIFPNCYVDENGNLVYEDHVKDIYCDIESADDFIPEFQEEFPEMTIIKLD